MNQRISACVQGTPRRGNEHIAQGIALGMMKRLSRSIQGGLQLTVWGESLLPILLSRIGLAISVPVLSISDAVHCNRSRSALQPPLQCTASSTLVLATFPASTCIGPRKYVHPSLQVRAFVLASTCVRDRLHLGIFPHVFLVSPYLCKRRCRIQQAM